MQQIVLSLPELALVVGTRAAGGLGLGLVLAGHMPASVRRPVGWTLLFVGVLTTLPLAMEVFAHSRPATPPD